MQHRCRRQTRSTLQYLPPRETLHRTLFSACCTADLARFTAKARYTKREIATRTFLPIWPFRPSRTGGTVTTFARLSKKGSMGSVSNHLDISGPITLQGAAVRLEPLRRDHAVDFRDRKST